MPDRKRQREDACPWLATKDLMSHARHRTRIQLERLTAIHERRVVPGENFFIVAAGPRAAQDSWGAGALTGASERGAGAFGSALACASQDVRPCIDPPRSPMMGFVGGLVVPVGGAGHNGCASSDFTGRAWSAA
jgi:hypothetical protein